MADRLTHYWHREVMVMSRILRPVLSHRALAEIRAKVAKLSCNKPVPLRKLVRKKRWYRLTAGEKRRAGMEFRRLVRRGHFSVVEAGRSPSNHRLYQRQGLSEEKPWPERKRRRRKLPG